MGVMDFVSLAIYNIDYGCFLFVRFSYSQPEFCGKYLFCNYSQQAHKEVYFIEDVLLIVFADWELIGIRWLMLLSYMAFFFAFLIVT